VVFHLAPVVLEPTMARLLRLLLLLPAPEKHTSNALLGQTHHHQPSASEIQSETVNTCCFQAAFEPVSCALQKTERLTRETFFFSLTLFILPDTLS
jgi:hypothetical protein